MRLKRVNNMTSRHRHTKTVPRRRKVLQRKETRPTSSSHMIDRTTSAPLPLQFQQNTRQFTCDACARRFHLRYDLLRHREREHERIKRPTSPVYQRSAAWKENNRPPHLHQQQEVLSQQHHLIAEARIVTAIRERETALVAIRKHATQLSSQDEVDLKHVGTLITLLSETRQATVNFVCAWQAWRDCKQQMENVPETTDSTDSTYSPRVYTPYIWRGQDYIAKTDHDTYRCLSKVSSNVFKWLSELLPLDDNPLFLTYGMPLCTKELDVSLNTDHGNQSDPLLDVTTLTNSAMTRDWAFPKDNDVATKFKMKTKVVMMMGRLLARTKLSMQATDQLLSIDNQQNTNSAVETIENPTSFNQSTAPPPTAPPPPPPTPTPPTPPNHIEHVVAKWLEEGLLVNDAHHNNIRQAYQVLSRERRARFVQEQHRADVQRIEMISELSNTLSSSTIFLAVKSIQENARRRKAHQQHRRIASAMLLQKQWRLHCSRTKQLRGARSIGALVVSKIYLKLLSKAWLTLLMYCDAERVLDKQRRSQLIAKQQRLTQALMHQATTRIQSLFRGERGRQRHAYLAKCLLRTKSAMCMQREWRRNRRAWQTYHSTRCHAAVTMQSHWHAFCGRRRTSVLRATRWVQLSQSSFCTEQMNRRTFPRVTPANSPTELWKRRRHMAARLQRWALHYGLPGARKWKEHRITYAAMLLQNRWRRYQAVQTRKALQRGRLEFEKSVLLQSMGRSWLAKRTVNAARDRRNRWLTRATGEIGVEEYGVMRRKVDANFSEKELE